MKWIILTLHVINMSYYVTRHSEAAGLIERWSNLPASALQCQLGDNTLPGWGFV